ncbi:P-loop containing nucleoside triphosphate hydrolase protein [Syncephalis fuscata]|nr:P-loop containing nucleoside triphosphate hydrolase protein [Syncephalis fuscata]
MHGQSHRRKPISNKLKKSILQQKREKKREKNEKKAEEGWWSDENQYVEQATAGDTILSAEEEEASERKQSTTTGTNTKNTTNVDQHRSGRSKPSESSAQALYSKFEKLTKEQIDQGRRIATRPFKRLDKTALEVSFEDVHPAVVDFPKRPKWRREQSKEALERQEKNYFEHWMQDLLKAHPNGQLCFFERNLEVWRQLWRVLELSDVLLFVVDVRHPILHFPPALYQYVALELHKPLVLALNKTDLVSAETVVAWKIYLEERFPGIRVAQFGSFRRDAGDNMTDDTLEAMKRNVKKKRHRRYHAVGVEDVLRACCDVLPVDQQEQVDWKSVLEQYGCEKEGEEVDESSDVEDGGNMAEDDGHSQNNSTEAEDAILNDKEPKDKAQSIKRTTVTIGLIGHPNVGKSSLINSIFGRTVVSASRTPGHTKHFQTLHLSSTLRLCDGPGLVFPSLISRALQILSGIYNVAQVQEPYTAINFLAERVPVERILNLKAGNDANYEWTAWDICEEFAIQRGFMTARGARPDVSRAANQLLRMVNMGQILLSFKPPGFYTRPGYYLQRATTSSDDIDDAGTAI